MAKFTDYFNSTTLKGRANVAKATYASFAAIYLYSRFKKSNKKPNEISKINDLNQKEQKPNLEDNNSLQHFKCPRCECNKDPKNTTDQKASELPPPAESCKSNQDSSTCKPHTAGEAESIVKSSQSKYYYGATQFDNENEYHFPDSPAPDKGSCP